MSLLLLEASPAARFVETYQVKLLVGYRGGLAGGVGGVTTGGIGGVGVTTEGVTF